MSVLWIVHLPLYCAQSANNWDCVDSGKHLDYDGNSAYMIYVSAAAGRWNYYKSGVIRQDTPFINEDIYASDVTGSATSWVGRTYSDGRMYFNTTRMTSMSDERRTNIAAHELGHALGLGHSTYGDLMYDTCSDYTSTKQLSQNDKDSYDAAYNLY